MKFPPDGNKKNPVKKISGFISEKYDGSRVRKSVRHIIALLYRLRHIWKLSGMRSRLADFLLSVRKSFSEFNLLNFIFRCLSLFMYRIGRKSCGDYLDTAVQEKGGLNRHVLVRYLCKELFLYFFVAFLFFFFIFFVNQILLIIQKILEKKVPVWDVIRLMTYALPSIIAQSAPFATLVGFLMCLGRLVSENEILILRASGQGYRILLVPVLILGLIISVSSFFVNDYLLPLGTIKYNGLYRSILRSNPAVELEPNSVKRTLDKTLVIGSVNGDNVSDLILFDTGTDDSQRIIIADASVIQKSSELGVLMSIQMNKASVVLFDKAKKQNYDVLTSDGMNLNVFDSSIGSVSSNVSPREMTSYDLHKRIKNMETMDNVSKKQLNSYRLEYNKKFSLPFGSLFFAFLALPLALIFGKHNGQTIGLIIGLFICVLYWTMMILGQIFGNRGGLSGFWTMWLPNIVIGSAGMLFYFGLIKK